MAADTLRWSYELLPACEVKHHLVKFRRSVFSSLCFWKRPISSYSLAFITYDWFVYLSFNALGQLHRVKLVKLSSSSLRMRGPSLVGPSSQPSTWAFGGFVETLEQLILWRRVETPPNKCRFSASCIWDEKRREEKIKIRHWPRSALSVGSACTGKALRYCERGDM